MTERLFGSRSGPFPVVPVSPAAAVTTVPDHVEAVVTPEPASDPCLT